MTTKIDTSKATKKHAKRGSAKDKALSPDERQQLLDKLVKPEHRIILSLGCYAGLRVEEIIQCRFSWLSKEQIGTHVMKIHIPAEARDTKNKLRIWRQKVPRTRPSYVLESSVINEIYFWFYNNPDGLKKTRQGIHYILRHHFSPIVGRSIPPHALRATYTNYLYYENGWDAKAVAVAMGHRDIRTTMRHYTSMVESSVDSYILGMSKNK